MPVGLLARVTSNLYKEKAAQLQQQHSSSPPPSPPREIASSSSPAYAHPKLPAAAYLDESSSPSDGYRDPYATSPTLVLPDPVDTLQFRALAIDRPTSPSVAQPAPAVCPVPKQQMRCVCARVVSFPPARPPARARALVEKGLSLTELPFPARPPSRPLLPRLPFLA